MTREEIEAKAATFFEFPTDNKDHVTTTSAILFAEECCKRYRTQHDFKPGAVIWA